MGLALSLGGLGRFNPGQDPKMGDMQVLTFEDKESSIDQDYFDATRGYPWPGSLGVPWGAMVAFARSRRGPRGPVEPLMAHGRGRVVWLFS